MARILDMDAKYKVVIITLLVVFIVIVIGSILGSNVKDLFTKEGPVAIVQNEGELVVNYVDGQEVSFFDNKKHEYTISLTNTSNEKIYYSLYLKNINAYNVTITIKDEEGNDIKDIKPSNNMEKLINLNNVSSGDTVRFKIEIKPDDFVNFKANFLVENDSLSTTSFDDLILYNNDVVIPKSRVGDEIAVLDEGLISTYDNKGTTYYFRGNVKNNYVRLGNHLFRIVRINGDGTVRIVLDGVLDTQYAYNTNAGENYSEAILSNTSLLEVLNTWVDTELKDYSNYLANGDYCTDTNMTYALNNINYSRTYERIFVDGAPDLYCSSNIYNGKVGLLSIDEVVLAGAYKNNANENYYLYNKDISGNYLTTSTYYVNDSNVVSMMNVLSTGALGDGLLITTPAYIRPVVNVSLDAKIKGDGTVDNPYIIVS